MTAARKCLITQKNNLIFIIFPNIVRENFIPASVCVFYGKG